MQSWNACLLASALATLVACGTPPEPAPLPPPALPPASAPAPAPERAPQPAPEPAPEHAVAPPPAPQPPATTSPAMSSPGPAAAGPRAPGPAAPTPAADVEQPADARALFASFAAMTGLEARFEEQKHLALLAAPLTGGGRLYFMPPGHLARVVERPERSVVTISPTELRMSGKDGVESVDLRMNADVRLFVTSLVRVFSGDAAVLEQSYEVRFESAATGWTLTLTPRALPLSEMLAELRLRGSGRAVSELQIREPNGDRTVTRILEADTARRFSAEEQAELFGIPPR